MCFPILPLFKYFAPFSYEEVSKEKEPVQRLAYYGPLPSSSMNQRGQSRAIRVAAFKNPTRPQTLERLDTVLTSCLLCSDIGVLSFSNDLLWTS